MDSRIETALVGNPERSILAQEGWNMMVDHVSEMEAIVKMLVRQKTKNFPVVLVHVNNGQIGDRLVRIPTRCM